MTSWWRPVAQLLVVLGLLAVPAAALAQTSVIVLGVRSAEGDDEFARNLTGALRRAAEQVPGLQIVDRDVSLAQIMIVMGCDDPDAACMQQVATQLGVQRVVYGTSRRTTATDNYNYSIALFSFSAATNEIDQQLTASVTRARSDIDDLRTPAREWMSVLAGLPQVGSVTVTSNVEGAHVLVDGAELGVVAGGTFVAGELTAGGHLVEVQAAGHTGFRQRVTVTIGETVPLAGNLAEGEGITGPDAPPGGGAGAGSSFNLGLWVGVGSAVLGAVFVGLTAYAWAQLDSVNSDPAWLAYRDAAAAPGEPGGVDDICVPAEQGLSLGTPPGTTATVQSLCGTASTFEPLQYVFLALGVVGLGAGAFFIATNLGGHDEASADVAPTAGTVSLRPVFGLNRGGFEARLTF